MDGRWGTWDRLPRAVSGLCLIGLASVVAITSRATTHGGGGLLRTGSNVSHALGAVLLTIGFVVWMAATAILVTALWPNAIRRLKRKPEDDVFEPYRPAVHWWEKAVVLALPLAVLVGGVAAVVLFGRGGGSAAPTTTFRTAIGSPPGVATTSTQHAPTAAPAATNGATLGVALIVAAAIVLVAGAVITVRWRRNRSPTTPLRSQSEGDVAAALDWSLDDLRREPDPRRAVVAAYARMERLLGEHGVRRHRWEAPLEYLSRALARLRGGDAPIAELTNLYHEARFSPHTMGEPQRARAVQVLITLREELDSE